MFQKKPRKFRLITDFRHLNKYCSVPKFRNDDIRDAVDLVNPGDKINVIISKLHLNLEIIWSLSGIISTTGGQSSTLVFVARHTISVKFLSPVLAVYDL